MNTLSILAVILAATFGDSPDAVKTFHLKPGAPEGAGTAEAPFGSFAAAQKAVRAAVADDALPKGAVQVVVADGTYFLPETVTFGAADAGTEQHPVVWRAATKGGARFTGGVGVPKFKKLKPDDPAYGRIPEVARGHVGVSDLRKAGITDYGIIPGVGVSSPKGVMELVWDGRPQALAGWPNEGFTGIAAVPDLGKDADGKRIRATSFTYADDRVGTWANEPEPYGNGFFCYNWAAATVPFGKIDPATKTVEQKGNGNHYGFSKAGFWRGINLLCELDSPGEYYIDRATGRLYYWPTTDRTDPEGALTVTKNLLAARGLSRVTFAGLVFENCRGTALEFRNGSDVALEACTVRRIGQRGVIFAGMRNSRISGCDVSWCGAGAISADGGNPDKLEQANIRIENCHLHHYSYTAYTYAAAVAFHGCGVTITRCTVHDGPHTALIFGGREHTISYNEVHSVCIESGEMGAIYCGRDWTLCGNVIRGNWIHDIYSPRSQPNRAIMLDDGAAGIEMYENRFERIGEGISLSAIGNRIENNLFVSNGTPISVWQNWTKPEHYKPSHYTHKSLLDRFYTLKVHEEPWKSKYPYLGMIDDAIVSGKMRARETRSTIKRNCVVSCFPASASGFWIDEFRDRRYAITEETWDVADNVFEAGQTPAGWKPLPPLSEIGVYESPLRASWPVVHAVNVKYDKFFPWARKGKAK